MLHAMNISENDQDNQTENTDVLSMQKTINRYYVFGLNRSGTRAICYWFTRMIDNCNFINNVQDVDTSIESLKSKSIDNYVGRKRYSDFKVNNFNSNDALLLFYENKTQDEIREVISKSSPEIKKTVFIIRNPYNMIASKMCCWQKKTNKPQLEQNIVTAVRVWKEYFKLYYDYPDNFISYDRWYMDPDYREKVANRMGLVNVENGVNKIIGHGVSSFDKKQRVADDSVLTRYDVFKSDELYVKYVVNDIELKVMWNSLIASFDLDQKFSYNNMFAQQD